MFKLILLALTVLHCGLSAMATYSVGRELGFSSDVVFIMGWSLAALVGPVWAIVSLARRGR